MRHAVQPAGPLQMTRCFPATAVLLIILAFGGCHPTAVNMLPPGYERLVQVPPVLPADLSPLDRPVHLRFRPVDQFEYVVRTEFIADDIAALFPLWRLQMKGSVLARDHLLVWHYTVSGEDRILKRPISGEVELTSDEYGNTVKAAVLSSNLPAADEQHRPMYYMYLNPANTVLPLCCLPSSSVRQGDIADVSGPPAGPHVTSDTQRAVVRGVVHANGQRFLVVTYEGDQTLMGEQGRMSTVSMSGGTAIDIENALLQERIIRVADSSLVGPSGKPFALLRISTSLQYSVLLRDMPPQPVLGARP